MERINLKQLWKIAKRENQPLLGLSTDLATLDFMSDYLEKNEAFDRDIARERGFFAPLWNLDDEDDADDVFEQWQKDVFYFLYKNKENYQRLYDLLSITYDPLMNYDKTSVITDQESGSDTDTNVIGARHREDSYAQKQNTDAYGAVSHTDIQGQREDTTQYGATSESTQYGAVSHTDTLGARSDSVTHGAQSTTDNFGAVSESTTHGAKTTTSTEKIAGFNSATFVNSNSGDISEGQQADTHTAQARSDTHSSQQYIDNTSVGAQSNTHSENTRTDTTTGTTHTDTDTIGSQTNTHSETAKTDTHTEGAHKDEFDESSATDQLTKAYGHLNTHNERTSGNIGVTTSQQMAQSEIDLWNSFRFYDILIGDIIKHLCTYGDTGADFF